MEILKAIKLEIEHTGKVTSSVIHQSNTDARILGLKQEMFWPLLTAVVAGSFLLGFHFGGARFDLNKMELYESNKALQHRDSVLTVQVKGSTQTIKKLQDSVKRLNENLKTVIPMAHNQ